MTSETPARGIMRFIPTLGKLSRMRVATKATPFSVNGSYALSAVGVCLCIIGIQALYLSHGPAAPAPTPDIAAAAPAADSAVSQAGDAVQPVSAAHAGSVASTASLFLIVIGLLIALKPHILYYEMKRCGLAKDRSAGT